MTETISVYNLVLSRACQPRLNGTSVEVVDEYASAMKAGEVFPPVVVYRVPGKDKLLLVDGWHRMRAAKTAAIDFLQAEVIDGTVEEAHDYAMYQANRKNGQRLSRADIRAIVDETIRDPRFAQAPDGVVAEKAGVSRGTVNTARKRLGLTPQTRVGADGKLYAKRTRRNAAVVLGDPLYRLEEPDNAGKAFMALKLSRSMRSLAARIENFIECLEAEEAKKLDETLLHMHDILGHE